MITFAGSDHVATGCTNSPTLFQNEFFRPLRLLRLDVPGVPG